MRFRLRTLLIVHFFFEKQYVSRPMRFVNQRIEPLRRSLHGAKLQPTFGGCTAKFQLF
jgi:hypothetical protein